MNPIFIGGNNVVMKNFFFLVVLVIGILEVKAQFNVGADLVSRYIFRGVDYGNSAAIQPTVSYTAGKFTVGAWGSYGLSGEEPFREADLYMSYAFDFGLTLGLTDYYYPGTKWGEFDNEVSSHAFEANIGYGIAGLSLSGNYIINNSINGAGAKDGTIYFEAGYTFKQFEIFVGAGDGWHSSSSNFEVVNVGIGTSKDVKVTGTFSIPIFGKAIYNPNAEEFNIVFGLSL